MNFVTQALRSLIAFAFAALEYVRLKPQCEEGRKNPRKDSKRYNKTPRVRLAVRTMQTRSMRTRDV